jgi:putative transcriptional regulator
LSKRSKTGDDRLALLNYLKDYRSRMGINQTELGKLAGVSRQTISLIERGDYSPSVTLALRLAKICQVTVEDLFEYKEDDVEL